MPRRSRSRRGPAMGTVPTFAIVAGVSGVVLFYVLSPVLHLAPYMVWLTAWGITAFAFYGWDKMQAQRHGWRVPEVILHALALIGGFVGGWAGMFIFRHKTRNSEIMLVLIAATMLWGALAITVLR
jgi:uncharacterized membrane protein YsdA (DUF1294 family)